MSTSTHFLPDLDWRKPVLDWLAQNVPPKRLEHILGVEQTAMDLAARFGSSSELAGRAGLLHDLAKYFTAEKLLAEAHRFGVEVDSIQAQSPHLLHADVSAKLATELFCEHDSTVLRAIANHTLGEPCMDLLSQVLYVADWIEPTRRGNEVEVVRQASGHSLIEAVLVGCDQTILELIASRRLIHPRTVSTRNWAAEVFRTQAQEKPQR